MTTHFWAVPKIGTPTVADRHRSRGDRPELSIRRRGQRRRQGDARSACSKLRTAPVPRSVRRGLPRRRNRRRMAQQIQIRARVRRGADPARAAVPRTQSQHVPDDAIVVVDTGHAGMWMGGMFDLKSPRQSYMRSAGHLGWAFPGGPRRQMRQPRSAGCHVHRRCRLLVPYRRDRNRGALEHRGRDRRQQQRRRQSVEARLRSRLWWHSRPTRRANCGPSARSISPASPRIWARSASASSSPRHFRPPWRKRLPLRRPAVIDVVTDIEAFAPVAVAYLPKELGQ